MRQRQHGMTMMGLLCILVVVGLLAYGGIRLAPVYLNYMKVARTMQVTATEHKGENPDPGAITRTIERHWEVEQISTVDWKDIQVTKDDGGIVMHVAYDDVVPYIGNVSLSVHFDKTQKVE